MPEKPTAYERRLLRHAERIGKPLSEFTPADRAAARGHAPKPGKTEYQQRIETAAKRLGKTSRQLTPQERRQASGHAPKAKVLKLTKEEAILLNAINRNLRTYAKALDRKGRGKESGAWKVDIRPRTVWKERLTIVYTFYGILRKGSPKLDERGVSIGDRAFISVSDPGARNHSVAAILATLDERVKKARLRASKYLHDPRLTDICGSRR